MATALFREQMLRSGHAPSEVALPAPTAWPFVLAFGFMLLFAGLLTSASISVLGAVLALAGCVGWFREVFPHEREEVVVVVPEEITVRTVRRVVERIPVAPDQVRAWLPPRAFARLMIPAMLLLPMDVSANVAVAVLFLWAVAWYLCALLCALARITRDGARWLRPAPVKFRRFAWAVTRGSLFKQVQWTLTATALLIALGCRPVLAARFAEVWFAVVSITAALALTHARDSRPIRLKIAASICVLVALERVKQHLGALSAAFASAWLLRKAVRA